MIPFPRTVCDKQIPDNSWNGPRQAIQYVDLLSDAAKKNFMTSDKSIDHNP